MLIPNKYNGYSRDGIRLYHMDSGGSQPTSGGSQIQELPEWARPYAKATLEKGAALSEKGYQAYDQPRIAGFSPMQLQAQQAAAGMTPSAATGAGIDVAAEAAMRGLGTNYQAGQFQNQFQAPGEYQAGRFGARPVRAQQLQQYQMGPAQQVQAPELQQFQMGPAERVGTDSFTRAGTAEGYMSPYMQNVVDIQQREARRASQIGAQGQQAQAVGAGAFGGSRDAIMRAERERNLATQLGDIQATGQQAAFQNAQQQFNAEQARQLQAQQANQQAGLTTGLQNLNALLGVQQLGAGQNLQSQLANQQAGLTTGQQNLAALLGVQNLGAQQGLQAQQLNQAAQLQAQQLGEQSRQFGYGKGLEAAGLGAQYGQAAQQLGEQSRQYGAGLGLQGLQTALQGAGQLGTLGGQQFQQGMDINKLQSAYGGQQQALRQQGLSQAYEDFMNEQNYPYKQLGFMSDLIRGLPLGQQTTRSMYEPAPNAAQQIGALGMGAYGLSKFMAEGGMAYADGGEVQGYKYGGGIDSRENVEDIVSNLKTDQDLQKALMAARARGDRDQAEAVEDEIATRASLRRGIAGGITNQMADRMAGGGMVAFSGKGPSLTSSDDDESSSDITDRIPYSAGNAGLYNKFGQLGIQAFEDLENLKPYEGMSEKDRTALTKRHFGELQQFAGADPYAPMADRIAKMDADRLVNLEREKGAAAFEAIPAILEGRGIRGIGKGVGKFGSGLAAAAKADAAEQRALANQDFLLKDAQRKERMGLTRDAMGMTDKIEAAGIAAAKSRREALVAKGKLASDLAKAYRPIGVGAGGAGGAGKGPKIAEQLAAAEIEHETNPTDATLKKVTALRRAVDRTRTTDVGTQKASLAREAILARETESVRNAMSEFMYSPKFLTADAQGKGQEAFDAELERQRSLKPALNTPVNRNSSNNTPPPPPGFTPN